MDIKTLLFLVVLLLAFESASGQNLWAIQTQSTWTGIRQTQSITVSPSLWLRKNKFEFGAGPVAMVYRKLTVSDQRLPKLTGIRVGSTFSPEIKSKWVGLYLHTSLQYQRISDIWTGNIWDNGLQEYVNFEYRNRENIVEMNGGYGIRIFLSKHIYLYQDVGVGIYLSGLEGDELTPGTPEFKDPDFRGYENVGGLWRLAVGLGYRF
jgi:hypothetical protein